MAVFRLKGNLYQRYWLREIVAVGSPQDQENLRRSSAIGGARLPGRRSVTQGKSETLPETGTARSLG